MQKNRVFLQKMNLTLVYILRNEWPQNWPEFIPEIVNASTSNEALCENNMQILKLLSEEVFEVKDQMTAAKTKTLKERLNQEFAQIFQLCDFVLQKSQQANLLNVTLQTLQRFLTWIPLGYIFETQLIPLLITKFFPVPIFRNGTIECLTEIAGLTECPAQYTPTLVQLYQQFLTQLASFVHPDPSVMAQLNETDGGEHTIKLLALFFSSFFKVRTAGRKVCSTCPCLPAPPRPSIPMWRYALSSPPWSLSPSLPLALPLPVFPPLPPRGRNTYGTWRRHRRRRS